METKNIILCSCGEEVNCAVEGKLTPEQLRVANALAMTFWHEWARGEYSHSPREMDVSEIFRRTVEARVLHESWEHGIAYPNLENGVVIHRTGEGKGRLEWHIYQDGSVKFRIHRPDGVALEVFLGPVTVRNTAPFEDWIVQYPEPNREIKISFPDGAPTFFSRHWETLSKAMQSVLMADKEYFGG